MAVLGEAWETQSINLLASVQGLPRRMFPLTSGGLGSGPAPQGVMAERQSLVTPTQSKGAVRSCVV